MDHVDLGASDLETARLRLRPYVEQDLGDITRLLCDSRTTTHYPRPFSEHDAELWLQRAIDQHAADGAGLHVVERLEDGGYVGHCGPMWQEVDGRSFLEVGWMVLPDLWGRGYAPEAAARWHEELPGRFGVEHTASIIGTGNTPSQRVAGKIGLERGPRATFKGVEIELWRRAFDVAAPVLREAVPADAQGIAFAHVRCWQFAYRDLLPPGLLDGLDIAARTKRWTTLLTDGEDRLPGARCIVAARGEAILGFADRGSCRDEDAPADTHELYAIYLRPDQLSSGLGSRLLARVAAECQSAGARRITLWALEGNRRAARAYERAGWRLDGATKSATIGGATPDSTEVHEVRWALELD